jgi:glycosyltransferase involved in cell wall biosynthesis
MQLVAEARQVDIVHANGFSLTTLPIAVASRRPLIWTHHGHQAACLQGAGWHEGGRCGYSLVTCAALTYQEVGVVATFRKIVRHPMGRIALSLAGANVFVSDYVRQIVQAPRATTIHDSPDRARFHPAEPEIPVQQRSRLLYVGRLVTEKGLGVLLQAVAACRRRGAAVAIDIYGTGPEEPRLREQSLALGVADMISFRGSLRGSDVPAAIQRSAGMIVPSVCDEAFGIAAAEALACGRVPLVSKVGGLPEVVRDLPCTFRVGDADALSRLMERLVFDVPWRAALEGRAVTLSHRFSPAAQAATYEQLYRRVLGSTLQPAGIPRGV